MQPVVAPDPLVRIHHTGIGHVGDGGATDEVGSHRSTDHLAHVARRYPVHVVGHPPHSVVGRRKPGRVRVSLPLPRRHGPAPEPAPLAEDRQRVVDRLHAQGDDSPLRPATHIEQFHEGARLTCHRLRPGLPAGHTGLLIGEQGPEQTHRVRALTVADGFDVGLGLGIERGGDSHAAREVALTIRCDGAEDALGVRAGQATEGRTERVQIALFLHPVQQSLGVVGAGREDHLSGAEGPTTTARQHPGAFGVHVVATADPGPHPRHCGQRMHIRARRLRQTEVVLGQRVLGIVATARHALAALDTAGALRTGSAEERVGGRDAVTLAEEDPDRRHPEGVPDSHLVRHSLHHFVGGCHGGVLHHAEHPGGLVVVGSQFLGPVGDVTPGPVLEELLGGHVQSVRIVQGPAPHARTRQHNDVLEDMDPLQTGEPEPGRPEVLVQSPAGLREGVIAEPPARLEHPNPVTLLSEPEGGDGTPET